MTKLSTYCLLLLILLEYKLNYILSLKGLCDVCKKNLTSSALQVCYGCFTAALANDLWLGLFHLTQNILWLHNIAQPL